MKRFQEYLVEASQSSAQLKSLVPQLVKAAQQVYDEWDETDEDTYAGGGICHLIAEEIAGVLINHHIECSTVSASQGEQHVWVVAQLSDGVWNVDIPPSLYETGGGYSWKKRTGIRFDRNSVDIECIDKNPAKYSEYTED